MSKEFEEAVLKKLDNLETEIKDTKHELQNFAKDTNHRLGSLETEVKSNTYRLGSLEKEVKSNAHRLESLEKEVKSNTQRLGKLEIEVKDTGEVVKYLNNNFTKFDFEINRKIDTLFDANTVNKEKHDTLEKKINSLHSESFNHDIRISNLEDKVLTA